MENDAMRLTGGRRKHFDEASLAQEFLGHAVEFVDAAERLRKAKPFLCHPTFYCVLHGIDRALKSHLTAAGYL